ncbi:hypothetical protein EG827_13590, partial [bacterium]|nr:hypothetical protein [bacterium]
MQTACSLSGTAQGEARGIRVVSHQLRDRVIALQPRIRSSLIIGFKVDLRATPPDRLRVEGELSRDGTLVGRDAISALDGSSGSLCFDIPPQTDLADRDRPHAAPDGLYSVQLRVRGHDGSVVAQVREEFRRNQLGRTFVAKG